MKRLTTTLLFLTLLLGACSTGSAATESAATEKPAPPANTATNVPATAKPTATETTVPAREAHLSEVENEVSARVSSAENLSPASNGMVIYETGEIETNLNSHARLDLLPDGTIVRVGPNSSFTIPSLMTEDGAPKTKLKLLFGQIFIILNGGSLDVETPSGVASVRGSLMSVTSSKENKHMTVTCLEGHCDVKDEDEELELTEGQSADFVDGELEDTYRDMTVEELGLWMLDNPDLKEHIDELPPLPDLPENFDWNYDFNNDPNFEFFFDPEYNPDEKFFDPTLDSVAPSLDPTNPDLGPLDPEPEQPAPENIDPPSPGDGNPPGPLGGPGG